MGADQRTCCPAGRARRRDRARTTACLSKLSSTAIAPASPGATCRSALAIAKNVHRRFSRWARAGVWERVFQHLAEEADNEYAMIDSTIVRAHQHSAGAQKKLAKTKPSAARAAG